MLNNPLQNQLPNQLIPNIQQNLNTLNLTQIADFDPVKMFTDQTGAQWQLVKASFDSSIEIPDPKTIQIVNYWNHIFPNLEKQKVYLYVVEGIKQPRVETERPTRILYQWFSLVGLQQFTPQMISPNEWLKANVYASAIIDNRVSILNALCKVEQPQPTPQNKGELIRIDTTGNNQ